MKYYKVRNDILGADSDGIPNWSDEPSWLRAEIDTWDCGGRFFATHDARYSYIISPNDNLMDLADNDLEELTEEEVLEVIAIAFPPNFIKRDGEPDEIIPTPSLETVSKVKWGYSQNHTGNITSNETWTLANSPHNLTGSISVGANVVLTIEAGCSIYHDGNYAFSMIAGTTGFTEIRIIGDSNLPIIEEANQSRTGTATNGMFSPHATLPNNSKLTVQYAKLGNATNCFAYNNPTGATLTVDHILARDSTNFFAPGTAYNGTINFSNIKFQRSTSAISSPATTGAGSTITFTQSDFDGISNIVSAALPTNTNVYLTDCYLMGYVNMFEAGSVGLAGNVTITRGVIKGINMASAMTTGAYTRLVTGSVVGNCQTLILSTTTTNGSFNVTDTDIGNAHTVGNYFVNNGVTVGSFTCTMTNCYLSNYRGADRYNTYSGSETPAQVNGTVTFVSARTTRNYSMTPGSISAGAVGNNVTVSWTTGFQTRNRILVGTTSGVYTSIKDSGGTWANIDGRGGFTTSPSIVFYGSTGTTYKILPQSWDWVENEWISGTEQSVTIAAEVAPTFSGASSFTDLGNGGGLISWSAATGTCDKYAIYIKKDNATSLFTTTYLKGYVPFGLTSNEVYTYADGVTNIANGDNVYIGVRALNNTTADTNTVSRNATITSGTVPTFAGIVDLEGIGNGELEAFWNAGTGIITNYLVYVKIGSAPNFTEKPIKVDPTFLSHKFNYASDGTRIFDTDTVYVSVRAENGPTLIDSNSVVLSRNPQGAGRVGVIVADQFGLILKD